MVLDGIAAIIAATSDFVVAATIQNGKDLMDRLRHLSLDVCIVDVDLPMEGGASIWDALRDLSQYHKLILLIDQFDLSIIKRVKWVGVRGCLKKVFDADELRYAIRQITKGETYMYGSPMTLNQWSGNQEIFQNKQSFIINQTKK